MSDDDWRAQHAIIEEGAYALLNSSVPVIAAVNGVAFGGGCEIPPACDFIYAATTARVSLPEGTPRILPGARGTQTPPRPHGEPPAKEIALTRPPLPAPAAHR